MGTTFVTIDETTGFWMRDSILELWLRLLALNIEESPDENYFGREIRNQWLLASKGHFVGHVPHDLHAFANNEIGQPIIRTAIDSLLLKLNNAPGTLDGPTLDLLGIDGRFNGAIQTSRLIEIGDAFKKLLDGQILDTVHSTKFMPGSGLAT